MGRLDPVDLMTLAEALRDESYLDVRSVDVGSLERVRVVSFNVRRDGETVTFRQYGTDDEVSCDSESIRRALPTAFSDGDELTPLATAELEFANTIERVWGVVEDVLAENFQMKPDEFRDVTANGSKNLYLSMRYWAMLVMKDLGVTTNEAIYHYYGYLSATPIHSARWMYDRGVKESEWTSGHLDTLVKRTKARLAPLGVNL